MNGSHGSSVQTLCSISAGAILHQYVVEGLVLLVWKIVHAHLDDPLLRGSALFVPTVDHAGVVIPGHRFYTITC